MIEWIRLVFLKLKLTLSSSSNKNYIEKIANVLYKNFDYENAQKFINDYENNRKLICQLVYEFCRYNSQQIYDVSFNSKLSTI